MNPASDKVEYLYKILVIGDVGTGKTSIIKRYVHGFFSDHYRATIGVDFAMKILNWKDDSIIRLQLWDIAGQERFGNMTRVYYREASAAILVFDIGRSVTFDGISKWKNDLDNKVALANGKPIPAILLANKCDIDEDEKCVRNEAIEDYCKNNNFVGWFETSAKQNKGIAEAVDCLVSHMVENRADYELPVIEKNTGIRSLTDSEENNRFNGSSRQSERRSKTCC